MHRDAFISAAARIGVGVVRADSTLSPEDILSLHERTRFCRRYANGACIDTPRSIVSRSAQASLRCGDANQSTRNRGGGIEHGAQSLPIYVLKRLGSRPRQPMAPKAPWR